MAGAAWAENVERRDRDRARIQVVRIMDGSRVYRKEGMRSI